MTMRECVVSIIAGSDGCFVGTVFELGIQTLGSA